MILEDDRTIEQKKTHYWLVIGTDSFLSGWGRAKGGKSIACWACLPEHRDQVFKWVSSRSDMKRVRESIDKNYRPKGIGHCHIYLVDNEHPALRGK